MIHLEVWRADEVLNILYPIFQEKYTRYNAIKTFNYRSTDCTLAFLEYEKGAHAIFVEFRGNIEGYNTFAKLE